MQQLVAQIPWGRVVRILDKTSSADEKTFYVRQAIEGGWIRNVLVLQIEVPLEVGGDEFFVDLPFYHLKLHCYVVVELKARQFRPEHAGKLNFYLSAVDEQVRDAEVDAPTIGLLLCQTKNRVVAEYALRDIDKPIGVADAQLTRLLPERLERSLPTVTVRLVLHSHRPVGSRAVLGQCTRRSHA